MHSLANDARIVAQCENGVKSRNGTPTWCTIWLVVADFLHLEIRIRNGNVRLGPIAARFMSSSSSLGDLIFCFAAGLKELSSRTVIVLTIYSAGTSWNSARVTAGLPSTWCSALPQ